MKISASRIALFASAATTLVATSPAMAQAQTAAPAQPAPAQSAPAQSASGQPADTSGTQQDIVVTATKRSERLKDVPASISVLPATDLAKQGLVRFSDYATRVPGLSLTTGREGSTQITLRGITTGSSQPGSTTGYYVDEAPIGSVNAYTGGNAITPDLDPADLAQIEVLKGPQGTLYGAGAVGGLLKFVTNAPNFTTFEGSVSAGLSAVDGGDVGFSTRGMVNIPLITDVLALHVSGFYRRDPGYIDNVNARIGKKNVNDAKVRGGRAALAARLGSHVRVNLSALAQDTTSGGTNTEDVDAVTLKPIYGDLKQERQVEETGRVRLRVYNGTITADFGKLNLVSSTTYQRIFYEEIGDATRSYGAYLGGLFGLGDLLGVRVPTYKHTARWSEEARASANGLIDNLLDLQAGFYWTHESDQNYIPGMDTFSTLTGDPIAFPQIAVASINSTYREYSFFGNARVHLTQKFDVLGGIRYSHDNQDYLQDYSGLIVGNVHLVVPGKESANVTTWLVSPRYRFSDNLMVYGRVATGYRPGGPNPAPPTGNIPLTFKPDQLTQYEVGVKAQTLDRKLSVDAALFTTDWKDVQIQTSGGGFNYLVNGGTARSQGAELTLRYQPVRAVTLGANVGYTDAKLTSDAPAAGGVDGDRLPYVPRWSGSLTADYSTKLSGDMAFNLGATANFVGKRISDYSGRYPKELAGYTTFDLRAGIGEGAWNLSAFVKNVTNKRAILVVGFEGLAPSNTPGDIYSAAILQPRTVGLEGTVRF